MDFSQTPKKYILGLIAVMVIILVTVVSVDPGNLVFRDNTDYDAQRKLAEQDTEQYRQLLASVSPDYEASKQLLEKIATEDIVRTEVETALNVNQKVSIPTIANSELVITPRTDRPAIQDYVSRIASVFTNFNNSTKSAANEIYGEQADSSKIAAAANATKVMTTNLKGMPVPSEAVEMHKAYLVAYGAYGDFFDTSASYSRGEIAEPWPKVYGQYSIIENRLSVAQSEMNRLTSKYALNVPMPEELQDTGNGFSLIKTAHAQWPVIDVQAEIWRGIRFALARSFGKFAITMLDKLVRHIEKSFAIASQLYYSQDLGRFYSVEYMKKFVDDPVEKDIIQKFLPQYFCVNPKAGELKQIFTAKAKNNLGSDIVIDPNDPDFINKLAKLGDEKNYPNWWEDYYTTMAFKTQSEAEKAATKEVTSPGLKSGRSLVNGEINKTMSSIFNVQQSAIAGTINLGTNNTENPVSQIVAGIVESMVNKFVFTAVGAGPSGGGIGVVGEGNICLRNPKMKPVAPIPSTGKDQVDDNEKGSAATSTTTPPFR